MFDTMTITKATGAVCGSLLVYLLAAWAGDSLYHVGHDSHGGEEIAQAYTIDTGADEASEVAEEGPDFATLYAAADVAADFGATQTTLTFRLAQSSPEAGNGRPRLVTVPIL